MALSISRGVLRDKIRLKQRSLLRSTEQQLQQKSGLRSEINQLVNKQHVRHASRLPINTAILFVPQQQAWVVERFGKYSKILKPGLNILIPVVDTIRYVQSLKEIAIEVPEQHAITADNVTLRIDGVLYVRVMDPYKASYGVEDPEFAITMLAQTTMRSELGKIALDTVFKERDSLNTLIVNAINKAADAWGITCMRYEIRDIQLPPKIQDAMQMQVEAERKKRAAILQSEGLRASDINVAEGKKRAKILNSEALKAEQINKATGEAEAILAKAQAQAKSIEMISTALKEDNGMDAVSMRIAEQYVTAFGNIAKTGNTVLLPTNTGDVTSMVSQAMTIYKNLSNQNQSALTGSSRPTETDPDTTNNARMDAYRDYIDTSSQDIVTPSLTEVDQTISDPPDDKKKD